jgi:hypothetical protein
MANTPLNMQASRGTYATLLSIMALPLVICLLAARKQPSMWLPVSIWLGVMGFVALWLRCFRVIVSEDALVYSSMFGGRRSVRLQDIKSAQIEIGNERYWDRLKPPFRLVIRPRPGISAPTLAINLKVFARSDIAQLLSLLRVRELNT